MTNKEYFWTFCVNLEQDYVELNRLNGPETFTRLFKQREDVKYVYFRLNKDGDVWVSYNLIVKNLIDNQIFKAEEVFHFLSIQIGEHLKKEMTTDNLSMI